MGNQGGKERDGSSINNSLSQLGTVFSNFGQSTGRNTFERDFWFLDAEDEEGDGSDIDNRLSQFGSMFGNVGKGPGSSFLDGGVELFETDHQGVEGSRVNDGLSQSLRVLGHSSQYEGGGFFIETILFGKGHHELGKDFVGNNSFGEVFGVRGKSS